MIGLRTLREAFSYALSLSALERFEEAKALLCKVIPVARRILEDDDRITVKMRATYARALCRDANPTLDDLREAVTTLEDTARIARRVFGGAYPFTEGIESELRRARAALRARETSSPAGSARDPSAAADDATPPAPAAFAGSSPDGSSGEAPAAAARAAEAPSS